MNSEIKTKKEIELNAQVVKLITDTNKELQAIQAQLQPLQEKFNLINNGAVKLITGISLQLGVDPQKEGIRFSDDFKTIFVYDLPKEDKAKDPSPSKVRKMKQ